MPELPFKELLPSMNLASTSGFIVFILIGLVIAITVIGFGVWWFNEKKYNQKVIIFKKIGNKFQRTGIAKAKLRREGRAGDMLFVVKKPQKVLPPPKLQMGDNEWWYFIREDGEWINFDMPDMDEQSKKMNAHFVDFDMRMHRLGIEKNLKERHQKDSFWAKYGNMIAGGIFYVLITILLIVILMRVPVAMGSIQGAATAITLMAEEIAQFRTACQSGIMPVSDVQESLRPVGLLLLLPIGILLNKKKKDKK